MLVLGKIDLEYGIIFMVSYIIYTRAIQLLSGGEPHPMLHEPLDPPSTAHRLGQEADVIQ